MTQQATRDQVVRAIEYRNKVECYKAELIDDIESGKFYTARTLMNECVAYISDYCAQCEEDRK